MNRAAPQRDIANTEAEQALLGAIMLNNEAYTLVSDLLKPIHFHDPLHQRIFEVVGEFASMGKLANPVTIKSFLPVDETVGEISVGRYLVRLATSAVSIANAPDYARAIYDMAIRRLVVSIMEDSANRLRDLPADMPPDEFCENCIEEISGVISPNSDWFGAKTFSEAVSSAIEMSNKAFQGERGHQINYRLSPLERLIGPLYPGQLIILGGGTKQGKTALAGQIAMGAAREGWPVWIYSGEMTPEELAMREMSRDLKIPVWRQKRGKLTEEEFEQEFAFRDKAAELPIVIQDRRLTLSGIKERVKNFVRKKGKGVIFIDHIGLIERDKSHRHISDWEFGQEATKELKAIAREIGCPVVACAQLKKNTFAEFRGPVSEKFLNQIVQRKPRYSDLIGAVERDADHVIIPFRPEVFLLEHEPLDGTDLYSFWEGLIHKHTGRAQIVLALSREAKWPQSKEVGWDGDSTTFYEIGEQHMPELIAAEYAGNPMRLI